MTVIPYTCAYRTIRTLGAYSLIRMDDELIVFMGNRDVYYPTDEDDGVQFMRQAIARDE